MKKYFLIIAAICCAMGANAQIKVTSNGYVGIGTTSPQQKLHVDLTGGKARFQFSSWNNIYFDNTGSCGAPCLYPSYDWYLQLGKENNKVGTIYANTIHVWDFHSYSDSTAKCDFKRINKEQDKFKKLKSYKYHFTKEHLNTIPESERKKFETGRFGFKAQDLIEIYPELVYKENEEGLYSVNYIGFIPILVEMVQEQQNTIDAQSRKIKELEKEISANNTFKNPRNGRKNMMAPSSAIEEETDSVEMDEPVEEDDITTNAFLFQNTPNPFSTQTEIKYFVPENADNVVLYVFSLNGNLLLSKPITQTGNGSITISGSELTPGMYIYTLAVNGIEADSKRMILTEK